MLPTVTAQKEVSMKTPTAKPATHFPELLAALPQPLIQYKL